MSHPRSWATAALLAAVLAAGCATEGRVERGLEDALERRLGPADDYRVDVSGLRARQGEVDHLRAEGVRVRPDRGPVLDRIEVEMRDVRYDRDNRRVVAAEDVRATVWVRAEDLQAFLVARGSVRDPAVALAEPDLIRLRFQPELGLPLAVTAEVEGTIEGRGSELHFVVRSASAAGFTVTGDLARRLGGSVNPIVDLSELPIRLDVTSVRIDGGALRVEATGRLDAVAARNGAARETARR